jgi:hypothetical protein
MKWAHTPPAFVIGTIGIDEFAIVENEHGPFPAAAIEST